MGKVASTGLQRRPARLGVRAQRQGSINDEAGNRAGSDKLIGFATPPSVVPLPAAGWMLIAGVAGLGAMRRRKCKSA